MWRGIVIALLVLLLQNEHQAKAQQPTANETQASQAAAAGTKRQLPRTPEYKPRCERPQSREESELCAQWGGVAAAREANRLTAEANSGLGYANAVSAQTLWWTRAGFLAIIATLFATAWAAWAASKAAHAANRSVDLFIRAEAGFLVPSVSCRNADVIEILFVNRGRTPVSIIHADIAAVHEPPAEQINMALTTANLFSPVLVDAGNDWGPGPMSMAAYGQMFWLIGGAIFNDRFGRMDYCPLSVEVDRRTGATKIHQGSDFTKWTDFVNGVNKKNGH